MKPPVLLVVLLFVVAPALAQPATQRSIQVVMDNNYPPFVFTDHNGKLQGLLVDEWQLWEKQTGIKAEIHAMDWGEALQRMRAGEFDVIDTIFKTDDRSVYFDFTKPYARIEVPIFFQKDIPGISGLASLKGFAVAAKAGDAAVDLLRQNGITTVLLFTNYEAVVRAAKQHQLNVFVMDAPPALYFLHKLQIQDEFRRSAAVNVGEFRRAVKKSNVVLLKTIEKGFASLNAAELRQIHEKWYGKSISDHPNLRLAAYIAAAALLLLAGLVVWNLALNRLVNRRTTALQQSELRLRASEKKFRSIFENAPIGIFQSSISGRLLNVNTAATRMFGYDSPEHFVAAATDMANQIFVSPEQRKAIVEQALGREKFACHEVQYRRRDGSVFTTNLYMRTVRDESGQAVILEGFVEDITQRKQAETELRQSEEQFRLIMNNLADLVAMLDLEGRRLYNSPSYTEILGAPDELRGTSSFAEIHPEDRNRVQQAFQETVRTGIGQRLEYRLIAQDGMTRHIESQGSVIRGPKGEVSKVLVVSRDVTNRKRAEEALHQMSARLLQVQDLERRHLARELHDTTSQHLAALTINLANLKNLMPAAPEPVRALCCDCIQLANQAAKEIRTHAYLLHPPLLDVMGLSGAVADYAQGYSVRSGIAVDLEVPQNFGRLPEDMELALFRVIQESLANVLKHSGSARVHIRFTRQAGEVAVQVQDMGKGIPADKLARIKAMRGSGVGLAGIRERLHLLGGRMDIESSASGTTLRATVPLASPGDRSAAPNNDFALNCQRSATPFPLL